MIKDNLYDILWRICGEGDLRIRGGYRGIKAQIEQISDIFETRESGESGAKGAFLHALLALS
jgi:hypothetical protein